jgi:hypothetical protein
MVRRVDQKRYDDNAYAKSTRRNFATAGLSLLATLLSAERKIGFHAGHICLIDARCFAKPTFALRVFCRQQMASRGARPQDFATRGDLEAFRHCFTRFAACDGLRHRVGKIAQLAI